MLAKHRELCTLYLQFLRKIEPLLPQCIIKLFLQGSAQLSLTCNTNPPRVITCSTRRTMLWLSLPSPDFHMPGIWVYEAGSFGAWYKYYIGEPKWGELIGLILPATLYELKMLTKEEPRPHLRQVVTLLEEEIRRGTTHNPPTVQETINILHSLLKSTKLEQIITGQALETL